jgi:hypothetical protein
MDASPFGVPLLRPAKVYTESHTSRAIAAIATLVKAHHLCLRLGILSPRQTAQRNYTGSNNRQNGRSHNYRFQNHGRSLLLESKPNQYARINLLCHPWRH